MVKRQITGSAIRAQVGPSDPAPLPRKKPEDTADGCRALAQDDRARAATAASDHMRNSLERSADAWIARANLLKRFEANFNARTEANLLGRAEQSSLAREHNG